MAYTAQQLITEAWYLSGIVSAELETVSNPQLMAGLDRLNAALAFATSNNELIPYWTLYEFDMVVGQEVYPIPYLVEVETVTFNIQDVRYAVDEATREEYFAYTRVDSIETLPYQWHLEPQNGFSNLYIYYLPQQAYPARLMGKFQLTNVTLSQDLTVQFDYFYLEYLKYQVASLMCEYYNVLFAPMKAQKLAAYVQSIRNVSALDLTQRKMSVFQTPSGFDVYAQANLAHGFYPP